MASRRSSTRSSAASTPHDRRTRSAGTAAAESSTDWCVIACGTSISDSTPPSDSASGKISVAAAIRVASGCRNETIPPKPGQRTSSTPGAPDRNSLTARPFSVCAATRRWSVRRPRWTRKQSNGPGTAPTAFWTNRTRSWRSGSRTTTAPPTTSEWPPRYFVAECTTASAPSSIGRCTIGVANVLSTATIAPRLRSTTPAMSTTFSSGFVGVSTQISRGLRPHRRARARRDPSGRPCRTRARSASAPCPRAGRCRRRGRCGSTTWSPALQWAVIRACVAAIPLENAEPSPPSSSPSARSSAARVGLAERA